MLLAPDRAGERQLRHVDVVLGGDAPEQLIVSDARGLEGDALRLHLAVEDRLELARVAPEHEVELKIGH